MLPKINAKLFGQIEIEGYLPGLYDAQGSPFEVTSEYLAAYIAEVQTSGEPIEPVFVKFGERIKAMAAVQAQLYRQEYSTVPSPQLNVMGHQMAADLLNMTQGDNLLLPGGWLYSEYAELKSHNMIYQIDRTADGFIFKVINSGTGVQDNHAIKTTPEKQIYNPVKAWKFDLPKTPKETLELGNFIARLLNSASMCPDEASAYNPNVDVGILYERIFPSISYLKGEEIDACDLVPEDRWTGSQLAGSCAQRSLHQLLKLNAPSLAAYQQFIFKFKLHVLKDFIARCISHQEPYTEAVVALITAAIDNNLKMLNIKNLFTIEDQEKYYQELQSLRQQLVDNPCDATPLPAVIPQPSYGLSVSSQGNHNPVAEKEHQNLGSFPEAIALAPGKDLFKTLDDAIEQITALKDPSLKYKQIEKLIVSMPINTDGKFSAPEYAALQTEADFVRFQGKVDKIQAILWDLKSTWLKRVQNAAFTHLTLSILTMQMDCQHELTERRNLPSFKPFCTEIIDNFVSNHGRDAYLATNDPLLDERTKILQKRIDTEAIRAFITFDADGNMVKLPSVFENEGLLGYFTKLLNTEPDLKEELENLYYKSFGHKRDYLHKEICKGRHEALYMVSLQTEGRKSLPAKFKPIIAKIMAHLEYAQKVNYTAQGLMSDEEVPKYGASAPLLSLERYESFDFRTDLQPAYWHAALSSSIKKYKYNLEDSEAGKILGNDFPRYSARHSKLKPRTANEIQLRPLDYYHRLSYNEQITEQHIFTRELEHLRGEPFFQISLTLAYFTRNVSRISDIDNQRFIEANLFQPGLLLDIMANPERKKIFLEQFDNFLATGMRYFTKTGENTTESMLFLRLKFLVNRYLFLASNPRETAHLNEVITDVKTRMTMPATPELKYVLKQYLFLSLIEKIEAGDNNKDTFNEAFQAYVYLKNHCNPKILEDTTHSLLIDQAIVTFQRHINLQTTETMQQVIQDSLPDCDEPRVKGLSLNMTDFPVYQLTNNKGKVIFEFNAMLGQLYSDGFAKTGLPVSVRNHSLLAHLGFDKVREAYVSADGRVMKLEKDGETLQFLYKQETDQLTAFKTWDCQGDKDLYELKALTKEHAAKSANDKLSVIKSSLPKYLTDASMEYWQNMSSNDISGLLVKNKVPVYALDNGSLVVLDEHGLKTPYHLEQASSKWAKVLNKFESNDFLLAHVGPENAIVNLPRYNLVFEVDKTTDKIIFPETGEEVEESVSPIHPSIAGLNLVSKAKGKGQEKDQMRCIVPVARLYGKILDKNQADPSDFFPIVHDTDGTIARAALEFAERDNDYAPKRRWDYENNEKYVSFRIEQGEPVADTVADALYLSYLYLASNQPEKAWKTLNHCTSLGGLTGSPQELQYLRWICTDLPHTLPPKKPSVAKMVLSFIGFKFKPEERPDPKGTPPHVACKLKSLSLLTDFFSQERQFEPKNEVLKGEANLFFDRDESQKTELFVTNLSQTVFEHLDTYSRMMRHLDASFVLSEGEQQSLFNHTSPKGGSLGHQAGALRQKFIAKEGTVLLNQAPLTQSQVEELQKIKQRLDKRTTVLIPKPKMGKEEFRFESAQAPSYVQSDQLSSAATKYFDSWSRKVLAPNPVPPEMIQKAMADLSSNLSDNEFVLNWGAYFKIACNTRYTREREVLLDFCKDTLIATRKGTSRVMPGLCAFLYRALMKTDEVNEFINTRMVKEWQDYNYWYELAYEVNRYTIAESIMIDKQDHVADSIEVRPEPLPRPTVAQRLQVPLVPESGALYEKTGIKAALRDLTAQDEQDLQDILKDYRQLEEDSIKEIDELGKQVDHDVVKAFELETKAGKSMYTLEVKQRELAKTLMEKGLAARIAASSKEILPNLATLRDQAWTTALALANEGPADPDLARKWRIEVAAKTRPVFSKSSLCLLYAEANPKLSMEKTGLSAEKVQQLQEQIHAALVLGIKHETVSKVAKGFEDAGSKQEPIFAAQALDLLAKKEIPSLDEPAMVLLQHEEKIVLRKRQEEAARNMFKTADGREAFLEIIEKVIMGGGKSKVMLPILAEKKAKGDNLVVVEVPQALLPTNHVDLNRTSERLFGKKAHRFEFNRDSNCSPKRLKRLFRKFTNIMVDRDYLVTTGESMQALELKYVELLLTPAKARVGDWYKQMKWCDKLINLFRNQGDCVIDEVHQGLWLKKKLNYTCGDKLELGSTLINNALGLYKLIDPRVILEAPYYSDTFNWDKFKEDLARKLINEPKGPIADFVEKVELQYGSAVKDELLIYLSGKAVAEPKVVTDATNNEKSALAYFKQQISILLPQTLVRRLDEHYGASKLADLSPEEQTLAIPYSANNIPNEQSRFGNELEAMNYTIQMMLLKGVSLDLLVKRLKQMQKIARTELFLDPELGSLDATASARNFAAYEPGIKLSELCLDDKEQMSALHKRLQFNQALMYELLKDKALKQIHRDAAVLHSDSHNHVAIYRSVQGLSGTPSNFPTFNQRLSFNATTSLGTDGYILEIMHSKNTAVFDLKYDNAVQFVQGLFEKSAKPAELRAIIDVGAIFKGVVNYDVAKALAEYISSKQDRKNPAIKHILYFNDKHELCAIQVNAPEKPILIKSSDVADINRKLGSTPEERFTYYDQAHTVGTDIVQGDEAHALVLVDEKVQLQSFLQGSMRMRKLSQKQTMEIVTPENLKDKTREELISRFVNNFQETSAEDNLFAGKEELANYLRNECLKEILKLSANNLQEKAEKAVTYRRFLEEIPSDDLYALYGGLYKKEATTEIFKNVKEGLIKDWKECRADERRPLSGQEQAGLDNALQALISKAIKHCRKEYAGTDSSFSKEVQRQVQKEIMKQTLVLKENFSSSHSPERQISWEYVQKDFYRDHRAMKNMLLPMENLDQDQSALGLFSNNFRTSRNYAKTYIWQNDCVGGFLKPVMMVWYHVENGVLHALLVTPQEALDLAAFIDRSQFPESWLSTTDDVKLWGKRPEGVLETEEYQRLREQARFFNGELESLLTQDAPLHWLKEDPAKKMKYYEDKLMLIRPGTQDSFAILKQLVIDGNKDGYEYIASNPFKDHTELDWNGWKTLFPSTIQVQATEYNKLALAFKAVNQRWKTETVSADDIRTEFTLASDGFTYLKAHVTHLSHLKSLIALLEKGNFSAAFMKYLPLDELTALQKCIKMPIDKLYELYDIGTIKGCQLANIRILLSLRANPALEDNAFLNQRLVDFAQQTTSTDILLGLLKTRLPLNQMFSAAMGNLAANAEVLADLLNTTGPLDTPVLLQLFGKCQTPEDVDKLLARTDLKDEVLQAVFTREKDVMTESRLQRMAQACHKSEEVFNAVVTHKAFTTNVATELLRRKELPAAATVALGRSLFDKRGLTTDATEIAAWEQQLVTLFEQSKTVEGVSALVKENKQKINPALGLKVWCVFGNEVISELPAATEMVNTATEKDVDRILAERLSMPEEALKVVVAKATTTGQIDALLARGDITASIAEPLFSKPEFSGKLPANCDWLTEDECLKTLDKAQNYDSFYRALTHANLTEKACQKWLDDQYGLVKQAKRTESPAPEEREQVLLDTIRALKVKAAEHALKAKGDMKDTYEEVAKIAFNLHQNLSAGVKGYFKSQLPNTRAFFSDCRQKITASKSALIQHRGFKQVFLDIINALLFCLTLGLPLVTGNSWRFFKANTDSMNVVEKVAATIDKHVPQEAGEKFSAYCP